MQVIIRFKDDESLEDYLQTLKAAGVRGKNYRRSKRKSDLLTVTYKDQAQFKELTKEIEGKVKIFGDIQFKPFEEE